MVNVLPLIQSKLCLSTHKRKTKYYYYMYKKRRIFMLQTNSIPNFRVIIGRTWQTEIIKVIDATLRTLIHMEVMIFKKKILKNCDWNTLSIYLAFRLARKNLSEIRWVLSFYSESLYLNKFCMVFFFILQTQIV